MALLLTHSQFDSFRSFFQDPLDKPHFFLTCHQCCAAGTTEFRHYSLADEIVSQTVRWGFGYFNEERQKWITYLDPINEGSREVLPESDRERTIAPLVQLLHTSDNESTRRLAADSLGTIAVGNEQAIAALVQLLHTTDNESTRRLAAQSLGTIDPGNEEAIAALVQLLHTTDNESTHWLAALTLKMIAVGNEQAIAALVQLLHTTDNKDTRRRAAGYLGTIAVGNEEAIAALVQLLHTTDDESTCRRAAESLGTIAVGNEQTISALVQLLHTTDDESTCRRAAESLGNIDPKNEEAIAALVQLLHSADDETIRYLAALTLTMIAVGNEQAIVALVQLLQTTDNEDNRMKAARSLVRIDPGNKEAIAVLVQLLQTTDNEDNCRQAAESLERIVKTQEQYQMVIAELKDNLSDEVYEHNINLFKTCYYLIWNCAQNLSYPDFYQAWYFGTEKPPTVDLSRFPQQLRSALPDTVRVLCIDGSKFADADNPSKQIYRQMTRQGCEPYADGKPQTMADLQDYWDDLNDDSDDAIVLICYENPQPPEPQGFSRVFLELLSCFDGKIAIVSDMDNAPLRCFHPQQPDLIEAIVRWIVDRE